jgi:hypothetical protein
MKRVFLLAGLMAACTTAVQAVDLNTDALKSMQKEGHKIVADSQSGKAYKTSNGLCLEFSGGGLVVRKCNAKANKQKWKFDGQKRLVAYNGKCVDGAKLKKCGAAPSQKWKLDGKKRLANNSKQCLQAEGNPPKAGAKVVTAACGKAPNQVWKE